MKFDVKELIQLVADKYGVDEPISFLAKAKLNNLTGSERDFVGEIGPIIGLVFSADCDTTSVSMEDLENAIPIDVWERMTFIDDLGNAILSKQELKERVQTHKFDAPSNESVDSVRLELLSNIFHEEFPGLSSIERDWTCLEKRYEVIDRYCHAGGDPLSSFSYYVDSGFYPPPELLLEIGRAIQNYFGYEGKVSLDEVLLGEKHKKTRCLSYRKAKQSKYALFNFLSKSDSRSLEERAELMLAQDSGIVKAMKIQAGVDSETDVESFLRSYRRWKSDMKTGKFS